MVCMARSTMHMGYLSYVSRNACLAAASSAVWLGGDERLQTLDMI